jgi:hypothetical protein
MEQLKKHQQEAQEAMKMAQERLGKESNFKPFQVNNKVWLEGTNLNLPYLTKKLAPRQYGPFRVVTRISNVTYRLELPSTWKIHDSFHTSLLTPYKETEKHGPNFLEPPPDILDGKPEWEVEKLMGHWLFWNKEQYLVRWKGYSPAHDQWVGKMELHAPDLVHQYQEGLGAPRIEQDRLRPKAQQPQNQTPSSEMTQTKSGPIAKRAQNAQQLWNQNQSAEMTWQKSEPIAKEAQKGQTPSNKDTRNQTNSKEPSSSVSQQRQSTRINKQTPQHQSARTPPITHHQGRTYIRTIRIVDDLSPAPTPMSLPLFTPSPENFIAPLLNDNDTARRPDTP